MTPESVGAGEDVSYTPIRGLVGWTLLATSDRTRGSGHPRCPTTSRLAQLEKDVVRLAPSPTSTSYEQPPTPLTPIQRAGRCSHPSSKVVLLPAGGPGVAPEGHRQETVEGQALSGQAHRRAHRRARRRPQRKG